MTVLKKLLLTICFFAVCVLAVAFFLICRVSVVEPQFFGVTFSKKQAEVLSLNWQQTYLAVLDDLQVKKIRIPVYWTEVEPEKDVFSFEALDWMVEIAEERGVEIILAVGRKVPRWPECHTPRWAREFLSSNFEFLNQRLLNYIETTIRRYDGNAAVTAWQVENEPFLKFGDCPGYDKYFIDQEISLVKSLSKKPIIVTDGGEFGDWFRAYKRADIFGSTMYRHIYYKGLGEFTYPLPSWFFRLKRGLVELFLEKKPSFVAELQAEPWAGRPINQIVIEEQYELFGPQRFNAMMNYIKGTGFDTFYFWGAEWWYWLKEQGHPEMWEAAREVMNKTI